MRQELPGLPEGQTKKNKAQDCQQQKTPGSRGSLSEWKGQWDAINPLISDMSLKGEYVKGLVKIRKPRGNIEKATNRRFLTLSPLFFLIGAEGKGRQRSLFYHLLDATNILSIFSVPRP